MDNQLLQHDLLYIEEHLTCNHYRAEVGVGFVYKELKKGQEFTGRQISVHQLLFFLDGSCEIDYVPYTGRTFSGGEMILLPYHASFTGRVTENLRLLTMLFEAPLSGCDKLLLHSYDKFRAVCYDFQPTPIRYPLSGFFDLLVYCLRNGMSCAHLHEMKHRELFMLLRGFYTKMEIAYLFHEIINQSFDFRKFIYNNHMSVCTLNGLIALSNMSRSTFMRKFKKEFKETAYQWMLKQISLRIVQRLADPDVTIKEIMAQFGFTSYSNFNRFCKRHYDCSPRELSIRSRRPPDCRDPDGGAVPSL